MMAADRDQEAAAAAATTITIDPMGRRHVLGTSEARAPLRWPYTSRAQQERTQRAAAAREESGSDIESSEASEEEEKNSNDGRENDEEVDPESGQSERSSPSTLQAAQPPREDDLPDGTVPGTVTVFTDKWVAERRAKMFVVGAAGPTASGLHDAAAASTKLLLALAWADVQGYSKAEIDALRKSFGNFDKVVALGWLVGDAVRPVGSPLLERREVHLLGLKVKYEVGKVEKEKAKLKLDAQRAAGRLHADDPRRLELMQEAEQQSEALMAEVVELPIDTPSPAAAAQASGSRKRAREQEPSHEEIIAELDHELLAATKWVKEAEAELARASRAAEQKERVCMRMTQKLEEARKTKKAHATLKETQRLVTFTGLWEGARAERLVSIIEEKEAENYLLKAQLAVSDCEKITYLAQWGHACELMDDCE